MAARCRGWWGRARVSSGGICPTPGVFAGLYLSFLSIRKRTIMAMACEAELYLSAPAGPYTRADILNQWEKFDEVKQ